MLNLVIVEDDLQAADVNRQYAMKTPDLNVIGIFHSKHTALDFLMKNSADLLLLDIGLPAPHDGLELLSNLRRNGKMIDVIMVTGDSYSESIEEAFHLGIVDYLIKPFTFKRFCEAMQKFLLWRSLQTKEKYTQADIDRMMTSSDDGYGVLPKGLQQQTLDKILECLTSEKNFKRFMTSDQVSGELGLSKMTIRRYMNYLIEEKKVVSRVNYSTGGRPSIEYAVISK